MPTLNIFSLFRETDEEFIARTGWVYQPLSPVYGLSPDVQVGAVVLGLDQETAPEGALQFSCIFK